MMNMKKTSDSAVSPVIGVLLMLVITIIIAAVVSGFAGGLGGNLEKAPQMAATVSIANTGDWTTSYFDLKVQSVSDPIPSKDVQLITFWEKTKSDGTKVISETKSDFNTAKAGYKFAFGGPRTTWNRFVSPTGFGPGVSEWTSTPDATGNFKASQNLGNYTLIAGTSMHTIPAFMTYGQTSLIAPPATGAYLYPADYNTVDSETDGMQAILGREWNVLRPGDSVNVKLLHKPSQKILFEKNVQVVS